MKLTSNTLKQMIREALGTELPKDPDTPMGSLEKKMDAVAAMVEDRIQQENDFIIAELTNILTTFRPHGKVEDLASEAHSLMISFGYSDASRKRFDNWKQQMEEEKRENDEYGLETPDDLSRPIGESAK